VRAPRSNDGSSGQGGRDALAKSLALVTDPAHAMRSDEALPALRARRAVVPWRGRRWAIVGAALVSAVLADGAHHRHHHFYSPSQARLVAGEEERLPPSRQATSAGGSSDPGFRPLRCPPLPSSHVPTKRWLSEEKCTSPAAVLEAYPFHDEVIPTSVKLLTAAGADCVAVLKPTRSEREYDIFTEMRRWAPAVEVVHGAGRCERFIRKARLKLLILDTFNGRNETYVQNAFRFLAATAKAAAADRVRPPHVVLGCHNLEPFVDAYAAALARFPSLRFTIMSFHPAQSSMLRNHTHLLELQGHHHRYHDVVTSIPFYFGPDDLRHELPDRRRRRPGAVSILAVGELNPERKDYSVVHEFRNVTLDRPVELVFFGGSTASSVKAYLKNEATSNANLSVAFFKGNFSTMYALAQASHFVAPYIDQRIGTFAQYRDGKLASSLAVATGFLKPVIACSKILSTYGLDNQIELPDTGDTFAETVASAVRLFDTERLAYNRMRMAQCDYRRDRFAVARDHFARLLEDPPGLIRDQEFHVARRIDSRPLATG